MIGDFWLFFIHLLHTWQPGGADPAGECVEHKVPPQLELREALSRPTDRRAPPSSRAASLGPTSLARNYPHFFFLPLVKRKLSAALPTITARRFDTTAELPGGGPRPLFSFLFCLCSPPATFFGVVYPTLLFRDGPPRLQNQILSLREAERPQTARVCT